MERIFLIGMPGSGKTTLGRALASKMNWSFYDLDEEIEKEFGPINEIFENKGEEHFREIEREKLLSCLIKNNVVVACGGGTPCFYNNMNWMNWNGKTIYLKRNLSSLSTILMKNKGLRPMFLSLNQEQIMAKVPKILAQREVFYLKSKIIHGTNQHFEKSLSVDLESIESNL